MNYCTFKEDKGKMLDVQSQIYKFFSRKAYFCESFQKLNFSMSLFIQKSDQLILKSDLDHRL